MEQSILVFFSEDHSLSIRGVAPASPALSIPIEVEPEMPTNGLDVVPEIEEEPKSTKKGKKRKIEEVGGDVSDQETAEGADVSIHSISNPLHGLLVLLFSGSAATLQKPYNAENIAKAFIVFPFSHTTTGRRRSHECEDATSVHHFPTPMGEASASLQ